MDHPKDQPLCLVLDFQGFRIKKQHTGRAAIVGKIRRSGEVWPGFIPHDDDIDIEMLCCCWIFLVEFFQSISGFIFSGASSGWPGWVLPSKSKQISIYLEPNWPLFVEGQPLKTRPKFQSKQPGHGWVPGMTDIFESFLLHIQNWIQTDRRWLGSLDP